MPPKINAQIIVPPDKPTPILRKKPGISQLGSTGTGPVTAERLLRNERSILSGISEAWSTGSPQPTPFPHATKPQKDPDQEPGKLVWDKFADNESRKRTTLEEVEGINMKGLKELKMVGIEQYSEEKLDKLIKELSDEPALSNKRHYFDMREEVHGFIDGNPISIYGRNNWDNVDVAAHDIADNEYAKLSAIVAPNSVFLEIPQRGTIAKNTENLPPLHINPKKARVETEEELLKRLDYGNGTYHRFPVSDHARPDDDQVDEIVSLMRRIQEQGNTFIVHCHGGMGRTTTMMVMYDMLRNAPDVSCEEIMTRQVSLRRKKGSDPKDPKNAFKADFAYERDHLLVEFHLYARHNSISIKEPLSWKGWMKDRGVPE
ncbi:MAG: hypothetical protein Q9202_007454 [Teloschistes flavicans]